MSLEGWRIGQYRLKQLIKRGGMGEVYLATDTYNGRNVAFKVGKEIASTHPDLMKVDEADYLFRREAAAISRLRHEHILRLLDYDEKRVNGRKFTYIVMPYCEEGSFADWLKQHPYSQLSLRDIAHFLNQAAEALQYAHDHDVIHRDVKPSNFLIYNSHEHPNQPDLLLSDFGIAKISTLATTTSTYPRGTAAYIAPEHWDGHPNAATDQYALAIMGYELLTGHRPFQHDNPLQLMRMHCNIIPEPPSASNPHIPSAINAVIMRALEKNPEDRFPSISAFAHAFEQALPVTHRKRTNMPSRNISSNHGKSLANRKSPALNHRRDISAQRKEVRKALLERKKGMFTPFRTNHHSDKLDSESEKIVFPLAPIRPPRLIARASRRISASAPLALPLPRFAVAHPQRVSRISIQSNQPYTRNKVESALGWVLIIVAIGLVIMYLLSQIPIR